MTVLRLTPGSRAAAVVFALMVAVLPAVAAAQEEESGGIAALGFNLPGLVSQLVNFAILMVVLRLFLYRPLLNLLDQRRQRIQEGLDRAEEAARQASSSEEEARRIMEEARVEGREAAARAQEAAQRLREELEQRARQDAEQIVSRARDELQAERDRAIQELQQQFADLTITAAERVLEQSIDAAVHQRLIDEVLAGGEFNGGGADGDAAVQQR
ncbi:MAG: F0F1 ATP synthase subunit B [Chloroflexi bacterium]|nr:F0F1 ATP synthase subunit B [Chloroflexota bacterium]